MRHRGPDAEGFSWRAARAGARAGDAALSIIDLPGGTNRFGTKRETSRPFNGELYNYRELHERLSLCGHRFATQSDTETLVHAWEEWGEDALNELQGMFAFALLDLRQRYATAPILFLARDPWESSRSITRRLQTDSHSPRRSARFLLRDRAKATFAGCTQAYLLFGASPSR